MRLICKSRTYQLSVETNKWNADDKVNYSHAIARRLPAEVLLDAVYRVTGSMSKFPGVPEGTRAAALPDSGVELPSGFLTTFGRPARESACECERIQRLAARPGHGPGQRSDPGGRHRRPEQRADQAGHTESDDTKLIDELFLRILNRPATPAEIETCRKDMQSIEDDHRRMAEEPGQARDRVRPEAAPARTRASGRNRRGSGRTRGLRERTGAQARPKEKEKSRGDRQARGRPEGLRDDDVLAKKMADWEKDQSLGRQPLAGPRAQVAPGPAGVGADQGSPTARSSPRARARNGCRTRSSPKPT